MRVKATQRGEYRGIRHPGDVFEIPDELYTPYDSATGLGWHEKVEDDAAEQTAVQAAETPAPVAAAAETPADEADDPDADWDADDDAEADADEIDDEGQPKAKKARKRK